MLLIERLTAEFTNAFNKIDAKENFNFVNLAEIKEEMGCNDQEWEIILDILKMKKSFYFNAFNGRQGGMNEAEKKAGFESGERFMLYVSK